MKGWKKMCAREGGARPRPPIFPPSHHSGQSCQTIPNGLANAHYSPIKGFADIDIIDVLVLSHGLRTGLMR